MHNTLNPLYKYISELIVEFFIDQQIRPGDRYNLYLEEKSYVQQLFDALRSINALNIELFSYQHPSGSVPFISFTIKINDTKVLVVSSENATEDYFTMLRNNVSQQALGFENTAMLIIYSQKLESISGGSENLEKDGMPLHYLSFRKRVEKDINANKTLKHHEKEILKAVLSYKTKNILEDNNSVFDYEFVIKILEKGTIDTVDFQTIGLFPHEELATKGTKVDVDIQENYKLFGRIEAIFQDDEPETELKEILPETAYTKFIKEDWKTTDFGDLSKWLETEKNKSIPEITSISCDSKDVTLWKRTDGLTASKKRNYNLLVFNQNLQEDVVIEIKFDQRTKKEGINYKGRDLTVQSSGYNLLVTLPKCENTNNFHLVEYRDPDSGKKFLFKLLHVPFESNYLSQFESNFLIRAGSLGNYLSVKDDNIIIFNEGEQKVIEEETRIQ
ncbi:hypothetical protein J3D55_002378 [Chryseobacterium ginsenosidimutans]|uniref:hypothetical protein n=1 Tax=Chryseobacterium ginsenosidimutans TaxID=687846 RepID=UPI002166C5D5|nr:hypothetical protein [Chryseobacterium ginsenosidimutans]MCS3869462.1 hypothetical protein [Chryseobacterium ginsenosidimutans]